MIMIQRIQSIFLLLAILASGLMFLFPILNLVSQTGDEWRLTAKALSRTVDGEVLFMVLPFTIHLSLATLIPLVVLFLYKVRSLQVRLTLINMVLTLGLLVLMFLYGVKGSLQLEGSITPGFISIMPIISFILQLMAFRAIRRDDLLIRGLDRIR